MLNDNDRIHVASENVNDLLPKMSVSNFRKWTKNTSAFVMTCFITLVIHKIKNTQQEEHSLLGICAIAANL